MGTSSATVIDVKQYRGVIPYNVMEAAWLRHGPPSVRNLSDATLGQMKTDYEYELTNMGCSHNEAATAGVVYLDVLQWYRNNGF